MKPVSLRFKNFGPFIKEQYIDFARLEKSGLFLIYGNTGSGKTSLLDAICCALYCESSSGVRYGGGGTDSFNKMRCQQAPANEETFVEFIFENGERKYRFYREMKLNTRGVNFNYNHTCGEYDGENYVPFEANLTMEKVSAYAEKITGLTANQFRQVVILPQGQFEKLLTSTSKEKETILSGIFDVERWDRITTFIAKKVSEKEKMLAAEKASFANVLGKYGCDSSDKLGELIESEKQRLEENKETEKALSEEIDKLEKGKEALLDLEGKFKELDKRNRALEEIAEEKKNSGEEAALLDRAEEALKIKPVYDKSIESADAEKAGKSKADEAGKKAEESAKAFENAKKAKEDHDAKKESIREKADRKALCISKKNVYADIDEKAKALAGAKAAYESAEKSEKKAQDDHKKTAEEFEKSMASLDIAQTAFSELRREYDKNICGVIASELEDGKPCPVCGSTSHPKPASHQGKAVSKEDVDLAEEAKNEAEKAYKALREKTEKTKEKADNEKQALSQAKSRMDLAQSELDSVMNATLDGIASLDELERAIRALEKEIDAFDKEEENLTKKYNEAQGDSASAEAISKKAKEDYESARKTADADKKAWLDALEKSTFDDEKSFKGAVIEREDINRRRKELDSLDGRYDQAKHNAEEQKKLLEGKERPDIASHNEVLEGKKQECQTLSNGNAVLAGKIGDMQEDEKDLSVRMKSYNEESAKYDLEKLFSDRISGKNGIGVKRYVLGVMLDLVTNRANEMLSNIYGGRYKLLRSNEKAGSERNSGLAFVVEDHQCGRTRFTSDISGGEKFLVSLSLAIGLSDVVRARGSGINLEAIFIDEGFGTLDKECLADALYVLQAVREKNGMVGVISHVDELAETINAKIETYKGENGNRCEVFYE